jgi:hypothetical protein
MLEANQGMKAVQVEQHGRCRCDYRYPQPIDRFSQNRYTFTVYGEEKGDGRSVKEVSSVRLQPSTKVLESEGEPPRMSLEEQVPYPEL